MSELEPLPIPAHRWESDLKYLREIRQDDRMRWRLAPAELGYGGAHRWARSIKADRVIALSTGETLVRLPASPWGMRE